MHPFEHIHASDIRMAIALLSEPGTEALAGGTDLLGELKRKIRQPRRLVNLKTISDLHRFRYGKTLRISALVTVGEMEHHPIVLEKFPVLAQAASLAATPQLRNMGTVAGNLCQHPRCWYYRSPLFDCWLKGGKKCFAVRGENKYHAILGGGICHAVHPSDLAPALISLDARVQVIGPKVNREIPLEKLYAMPGPHRRQMTTLGQADLITEVDVPEPLKTSQGIYLKAMERGAWSFASVSVAAHLRFDGDHLAGARLVLGGVAPIPWRAKEAEKILQGQKFSEGLARAAGEAAMAKARPLRDNKYKVELAKALIRQALRAIASKD